MERFSTVVSIICRISSTANFFMNKIWICNCRFQMFELHHNFEGLNSYFSVMILSCNMAARHDMYFISLLSLLALIWRLIELMYKQYLHTVKQLCVRFGRPVHNCSPYEP
jgi:hypothetical protein